MKKDIEQDPLSPSSLPILDLLDSARDVREKLQSIRRELYQRTRKTECDHCDTFRFIPIGYHRTGQVVEGQIRKTGRLIEWLGRGAPKGERV